MFHNDSLAFLGMIKNQKALHNDGDKPKIAVTDAAGNKIAANDTASDKIAANDTEIDKLRIAVIDTETNWHDQVMSIGIAFADAVTYKCIDKSYYIFKDESRVGGMFSNVLRSCDVLPVILGRSEAMRAIREELQSRGIRKIFAYNAKFDYGHLPEISDFEWYDIMRLAAYRQYNHAIPDTAPCCKTGRLKSDYGVEPITRMLSGDMGYFEIHNAVRDAEDELRIMELLGLALEKYECAKL